MFADSYACICLLFFVDFLANSVCEYCFDSKTSWCLKLLNMLWTIMKQFKWIMHNTTDMGEKNKSTHVTKAKQREGFFPAWPPQTSSHHDFLLLSPLLPLANVSLTRAVAIDCEMVGVGPDGEDSILARVSLVNQFGKCIYDKYVKPTEKVTDYRTAVSGIRPEDIKDGESPKSL